MDTVINVLQLTALTLWSVALVEGVATITGCTDAFIRLQCPPGDLLSVHRLQLAAGDGGTCAGGTSNKQPPPQVPPNLAHLCPAANECLYEEDICVGKNDCVFYIGAQSLSHHVQVRDSTPISITYGCESGAGGFGSIMGITIVTLALAIALISAIFVICRRSRVQEEDVMSKYLQFDTGLSRSPSMSSEQHPPVAASSGLQPPLANATAPYTTDSYSSTDQDAIGGFVCTNQDVEPVDSNQITLPPSASIV